MTTPAQRAMRTRVAAGAVLAAGVFGLFGPTASALADPDPAVGSGESVVSTTRNELRSAVKQRIAEINRNVPVLGGGEASYEYIVGAFQQLNALENRQGLRQMQQQLERLRNQRLRILDPVIAWRDRVPNCRTCGD